MQAGIKAIVFRTARLAATKDFFEKLLNRKIKEISPRHFVIHSKGMRLVFLESSRDFEIEIFIEQSAAPGIYKDPNGISVIIS